MPEKTVKFLLTCTWSEDDLNFIAAQQGLSREQLTDEKLCEFLQSDLDTDEYPGAKISLDLTSSATS